MWVGIVLAALVAGELTDPRPEAPPCPSPGDVTSELSRLGATGVTPPDIVVHGGRMRVGLRAANGASVGSREVEAPGSCRERATVAAVLVATWMGIWPERTETAATSPPPARAPSMPPAKATPRPAEIGVTVTGAHDGNAAALGLSLELRRPLAGPLGAFVAGSATTEREQRVGPARAVYLCPALELGPALRFGRGRWQADVAGAVRLGVLVLRGRDLPVTRRTTHLVPGAAATLRLVRARQSWSPFFVVGATYRFARQELTLDDQTATAELPRWDAAAGAGVFWAP